MTISELLEGLPVLWTRGSLGREVKGIAYDSRFVKKDYLFVAVRGFARDGHRYIRDAVIRGATMIVAEHPWAQTDSRQGGFDGEAACACVPDSREALALLSAAFYGHPSRSLSLVGITGTNGKTTTSFVTKSIIEAGGWEAGLLGTIAYITGGRTAGAVHTTPESLDLQRYLREMADSGMTHGVLEVSSHALALGRVRGCTFRVAAFTNFSQDHLDFHHTMDEYFRAKSRLFTECLAKGGAAVLNWDDHRVRSIAEALDTAVITCGTGKGAMIRAENIRMGSTGLSFDVATPRSRFSLKAGLMGSFNVANILLSVGIAQALGLNDDAICRGVAHAQPVAGRFENIREGQNFLCIIDYAHTDDALRKILQEARSIASGRIITVFGCGGDRDRTKRPLMGAVAAELSDKVIVTTDNPRSEDPLVIIEDILKGIKGRHYLCRPDREEAIMEALSMAGEGDAVVITGKGHEDYQEIQGVRHHFSDREVVVKELKKLKEAKES
ncbi:MAG: UDP-N-acetylmuramoyl-L-alanyl-D-glutamate--2,6-diaminopimelate ligase [Nitrospiraceae bacterium]|nr:MAG: UDP-N-acetylmuramoyl-L-alanyl-D-glutamate--2,6-diaminopimelate ligase [Nitrospiraceae bacterium]